MDFNVRCNSLKCRIPLTDQAVVTTCSHIFCEQCSHALGLSAAHVASRVCPACQSSLANPDDAVTTNLNPAEDYKTSVLSGLSPTVIMECAGRGLAFWSYQSTQEIVYQEYLARTLTDKYNGSKLEVEAAINEGNARLDLLTQKLNDMAVENQRLQAETQNLAVNLKERTRKHQQTQELYDRLKRKQMTAATQMAAQSAVDESIEDLQWNAMNAHSRNPNGSDQDDRRGPRLPRQETFFGQSNGGMMPPSGRQHVQKTTTAPTTHRVRLGGSNTAGPSRLHNVTNVNDILPQATPRHRQPFSRISPNSSRVNGYGMSAGMKFGRPNGFVGGSEDQRSFGNGPLRRSPRLNGFSDQGQENNSAYF